MDDEMLAAMREMIEDALEGKTGSFGVQPVVVTGIGGFDGDVAVSLLQPNLSDVEDKLDTIIGLLDRIVAQRET